MSYLSKLPYLTHLHLAPVRDDPFEFSQQKQNSMAYQFCSQQQTVGHMHYYEEELLLVSIIMQLLIYLSV